MPIRINLLAEAQAAEELRRRDPAKRAAWVAFIVVAGALCWSSYLQARVIIANSNLTARMNASDSLAKQYAAAIDNQKKLGEVETKLAALASYTSNRFLQANVLDSLMHCTVDGIQITHLRTEQGYDVTAPVKAGTGDDGKKIAAKPGGSVEKNKLILDVKDSSQNPGDEQITKYITALAATPYFKNHNITTNNIQMRITGNLMVDADTGKPYIPFNLECTYPNLTR